jgi:hypothetical protein
VGQAVLACPPAPWIEGRRANTTSVKRGLTIWKPCQLLTEASFIVENNFSDGRLSLAAARRHLSQRQHWNCQPRSELLMSPCNFCLAGKMG